MRDVIPGWVIPGWRGDEGCVTSYLDGSYLDGGGDEGCVTSYLD